MVLCATFCTFISFFYFVDGWKMEEKTLPRSYQNAIDGHIICQSYFN